jgi:hypothetical protein
VETTDQDRIGGVLSDRSCVISWSRPERWIWIVALTALSVVKTGYYVFYDNHATQLPLVYQLQNPQLFPQDPFLGAMQGYMGWVWILVAKLSQAVSIELVLGLLFLLTRVLLIYSAARLGSVLVPTSKAAPFMAALLMALGPYPILGDGTLVEVYWEQSSMFMPLFVLTLALLLEGGWFMVPIGLLSLLVGGFLIYNTFAMTVVAYCLASIIWVAWGMRLNESTSRTAAIITRPNRDRFFI